MNRRRVLATLLSASAGAAVGLCGGCADKPHSTAMQMTQIQLGDALQPSNPTVAADQYFADRVSSLTKGSCSIKVVPGGSLGDDNRVNEMVRTGRVAFGKTLVSNLTAYDKRLGVFSLPYAFTGREQILSAVNGELGRRCTSILDESGLVALAYFYAGDRNIYNMVHPIRTPKDVRGLRIRVPPNLLSIDLIHALGGEAMPMATNDTIYAIRQHLVNGAENDVVFYISEMHISLAKYFSRTAHQQSVDVLLASKKWLTAQPADVRNAIQQAGHHAQEEEARLWTAAEQEAAEQAKSRGAIINDVDLTAFRAALVPVQQQYIGTFGDLGSLLPGI